MKITMRWAARTGAIAFVTATLAVGSTTGALATDSTLKAEPSNGPQIVSPSEYASEGGTDPQSMAPVGEVAPAQGASVQRLTDLMTETTGLELFQAPSVEEYEELGQTLTFSLGDGNYAHPLNITRLTVHNDVPSSVLSSDGDETSTTTLPNGSHLMTAVGADGIRVSTLSKDGQLTQWEAPATTEQNAYSVETLVRWARTVDDQGISASHSPLRAIAAAKPKCQLTQTRAPRRHGGSLHIQAEASMLCNQTGRGNFSAQLRQYHGLGIWKTKDNRGYTNKRGGRSRWSCTSSVHGSPRAVGSNCQELWFG